MAVGRCIILDKTYAFHRITKDVMESVSSVIRGVITPLVDYPQPLRAEGRIITVPAIAVLNRSIRFHGGVSFNAPQALNVLVRDRFRCQYCGAMISRRAASDQRCATMDHVIPRGLGGKDVITNVVACCRSCNGRKACRTPSDAGMRLLQHPRRLTELEKLEVIAKGHKAHERQVWMSALEGMHLELFAHAATGSAVA
jgi:hypothetical protein